MMLSRVTRAGEVSRLSETLREGNGLADAGATPIETNQQKGQVHRVSILGILGSCDEVATDRLSSVCVDLVHTDSLAATTTDTVLATFTVGPD